MTNPRKVLWALALCAVLVIAAFSLQLKRYEYLDPQSAGGQYLLRIDHFKGDVCWLPLTGAASQIEPQVLSIEPCN